jgi:PST family polysaccharide transporter
MHKAEQELSVLTKTEHREFFDTQHLKSDLKRRSVRGGAVTMASQIIKFLLQISGMIILARLLTPQDFGLVAMVTAITGFVTSFKDMGLSEATIQKDKINHLQVSTLFWINVAVSFVFSVIVAACAPLISWFYSEPRLTHITLITCGILILSGLTVQHQALLNRQMRFSALSAIEIVSTMIGILTGIALAWRGAGYWALVCSSAATVSLYAVLSWLLCGWLPGLPSRRAGIRSMLGFGGHLTTFNILNYFARNLDNILIGRYWGANSLALYDKAYTLLMMPLRQINTPMARVAIPALSRLQNNPERFRRFYLNAVRVIAYLTMPMVASMGVLSREIITLILGMQWIDASPIFLVFAFAGFFQSIANTTGWVFVSLNQTRRMAIWGLISTFLTCVSSVIGVQWGAMGVAISYTVYGYLMFYYLYSFCFKSSPLTIKDLFVVLFRPVFFSLFIVAAMFLTRLCLQDRDTLTIVFGCFASAGVASFFVVLLFKSVRGDLRDIIYTINTALRKHESGNSKEQIFENLEKVTIPNIH